MATRSAIAVWSGTLKEGSGTISISHEGFKRPYSFSSRFEEGSGTNPEELLGAAHAGCFSMALAHLLEESGHAAECIQTLAKVNIEQVSKGFKITTIHLSVQAAVPGISENEFQTIAEQAKINCPVSQALAGAQITLEADLVTTAQART